MNRTEMPFYPVLGETFEIETDQFHFIGECVCHEPCKVAISVKGKSFDLAKTMYAEMAFGGTEVTMTDIEDGRLQLSLPDGSTEAYKFKFPNIKVGNLLMGTKFIEPTGKLSIANEARGVQCEMEFSNSSFFYSNASGVKALVRT